MKFYQMLWSIRIRAIVKDYNVNRLFLHFELDLPSVVFQPSNYFNCWNNWWVSLLSYKRVKNRDHYTVALIHDGIYYDHKKWIKRKTLLNKVINHRSRSKGCSIKLSERSLRLCLSSDSFLSLRWSWERFQRYLWKYLSKINFLNF